MKLVSKYVLQLPDSLPSGADLVRAIQNHPELLGIPHSKLDCQAAVEKSSCSGGCDRKLPWIKPYVERDGS